jgi:hypothetical protein
VGVSVKQILRLAIEELIPEKTPQSPEKHGLAGVRDDIRPAAP